MDCETEILKMYLISSLSPAHELFGGSGSGNVHPMNKL